MLNEPHVENIVLVKHTGHRKKDQIKKKKFCSDLKKITSESPAKDLLELKLLTKDCSYRSQLFFFFFLVGTHPRRTITEQKQPDKSLTRVCSLETDKTSTFLVTEMLSVC